MSQESVDVLDASSRLDTVAITALLRRAFPPGWPGPVECLGDDGVEVCLVFHPKVKHQPSIALEVG